MPGTMNYFTPSDLKTQWANSCDFYGCCGAVIWFLSKYSRDAVLRSDLTKLADIYKDRKSVAIVILSGSELMTHKDIIEEFGFVPNWGPITNISTNNNLYGYSLDLNQHRKKTNKSLSTKTF